MGPNVADLWSHFCREVESRNRFLLSQIPRAWEDLVGLLHAQADASERVCSREPGDSGLIRIQKLFEGEGRAILIHFLDRYAQTGPLQRLSDTFLTFDNGVEDLISALPETIAIASTEWKSIIGLGSMSPLRRLRLAAVRGNAAVPFRRLFHAGFVARRFERRKLQGKLHQVFAEAGQELLIPWQTILQFRLSDVMSTPDASGAKHSLARLKTRLSTYQKTFAAILDELGAWSENDAAAIANRYAMERDDRRLGVRRVRETRPDTLRDFWTRQRRAVESYMDVERQLFAVEETLLRSAFASIESIDQEHQSLVAELDEAITWLADSHGRITDSLPQGQTEILTADNRLKVWRHFISSRAAELPEKVEVPARLQVLPGTFNNWRELFPREIFQEATERAATTQLRESLIEIERGHQSIVREIERARQVVAFAAEQQVAGEGVDNALSLLRFQREQIPNTTSVAGHAVAVTVAAAFRRTHTNLEEGQLKLMEQAARHGLHPALRLLGHRSLRQVRAVAGWTRESANRLCQDLLVRIGWKSAKTAPIEHVVVRRRLNESLPTAASAPENMPMIYRRAFRLKPVDDPRSLMGRDHEMAALHEARTLWEKQREVSVLIVGERGSGKTSLINCAVRKVFAGLEVVRSEFRERLTTGEALQAFFRELLHLSDDDDLQKALLRRRRVIVIEELERTFLRHINHYGAIRDLLSLIARTSSSTLWILATNSTSFRFLDAAANLGPHFSHRINAMAVEREHIREAILMRHYLSGLRINFEPVSDHRAWSKRARHAAGVSANPEEEFFRALYKSCGGVFRSAFLLWLRHIERIDGGVLYMCPPSSPRYEELIGGLQEKDLFTLAAILQHGSMTPGEHSIVFQTDRAASQARLDMLQSRELIEPDPGKPGLRIRTEAGEFLRDTLYRRNLA